MVKKNPLTIFFIGGVLFMLLIGAIKYLVHTDLGILGLLAAFIFGGVVGVLSFTEKNTFMKGVVFILALIWIIWAVLTPIETVGGNWVIHKTEFLLIGALLIILFEQNVINSVREEFHKKPRMAIGFFGGIAILIFISVTGILNPVFQYLGTHLWILAAALILWFIFLYFIIRKELNAATESIIGKLTKGRK